jgi:transcription antitermination factor NusG
METAISYIINSAVRSGKQPSWYAVYTKPHHEKKIFKTLGQENIEAYLPLQFTIKKWSDRKKKISIPLISCYVFVKITDKHYYKVLNVPGIVRFITFEGKAKAIPEKQIQLIKNILEQDIQTNEIVEILPKGTHVEIIAGPMTGICGYLVEYAGKKRVIVHIEEIRKSIMVNVPLNFLRLTE